MANKSRLRTKVMFQKDSSTKDSDGFETPTWVDQCERYCSVEPMQGREYWDAHAVLGQQPLRIRTRYDTTIGAVEPDRWRMKNGSTIYDIRSMVNVDLENRYLDFVCTTGTGVLD